MNHERERKREKERQRGIGRERERERELQKVKNNNDFELRNFSAKYQFYQNWYTPILGPGFKQY